MQAHYFKVRRFIPIEIEDLPLTDYIYRLPILYNLTLNITIIPFIIIIISALYSFYYN